MRTSFGAWDPRRSLPRTAPISTRLPQREIGAVPIPTLNEHGDIMGKGPETLLVDKIRKAILKEWPTAWILKSHGNPYQTGGLPDLLVSVHGHLIGIEVKQPKPSEDRSRTMARVTTRQWGRIEALRRSGATAGVAFDVEAALRLVRTGEIQAAGCQPSAPARTMVGQARDKAQAADQH